MFTVNQSRFTPDLIGTTLGGILMKRLLRWMGLTIASLIVLIAALLVVIYIAANHRISRHFEAQAVSVVVPTGSQAVAEGHRLFLARGCVDCHGQNLAGQVFVDDPAIGTYSGANLTTGKGGIGGKFNDGDYARAIRDGIAPDGRALIFMPSTDFHGMSDADVGYLIAYIRSVPPVDRFPPQHVVGPLARVLYLTGNMPILVSADLIDHGAKRLDAPKVGPTEAYGRYLAEGCTGCHGMGLSGGPIQGGQPSWPPARNLTSNPDTGLGKWTYEDFDKAMRHGITPSGTQLRPPMPWTNFSNMTDTEVKALWAYLHTLPPKPEGNH